MQGSEWENEHGVNQSKWTYRKLHFPVESSQRPRFKTKCLKRSNVVFKRTLIGQQEHEIEATILDRPTRFDRLACILCSLNMGMFTVKHWDMNLS